MVNQSNIDILCMSVAMTDILVKISENELRYMGLHKGFLNTKGRLSYNEFLQVISGKEKKYHPAGSSANVAFNCSKMGLRTGLIGALGLDPIGFNYAREVEKAGIISHISKGNGASPVCYILITPDGEKTIVPVIGVGHDFHIDTSTIKPHIFHTSGFELLTNEEQTRKTIYQLKRKGSKISFDLSDPEAASRLGGLENVIDILFMTEKESVSFTGLAPEKALERMSTICSTVVLKRGKNGSIVQNAKDKYAIDPVPHRNINTNGAGDGYCAGFLYGVLNGLSLKQCGNYGSQIASQICSIEESHL
jgi:sugar/nucleoside kinase (ribokinase family)